MMIYYDILPFKHGGFPVRDMKSPEALRAHRRVTEAERRAQNTGSGGNGRAAQQDIWDDHDAEDQHAPRIGMEKQQKTYIYIYIIYHPLISILIGM